MTPDTQLLLLRILGFLLAVATWVPIGALFLIEGPTIVRSWPVARDCLPWSAEAIGFAWRVAVLGVAVQLGMWFSCEFLSIFFV